MKKISIFLCLITTILLGETLEGVVTYVVDGDTLHLQTKSEEYKICFYGVDSPENTQKYGTESKEFLLKKVLNKKVTVEVESSDQHGRKICKIYYDNDYLNEEVIKNGYGLWNEFHAKDDYILKDAQEHAQKYKLGLWKDKNPSESKKHEESDSKKFIKNANNSYFEEMR